MPARYGSATNYIGVLADRPVQLDRVGLYYATDAQQLYMFDPAGPVPSWTLVSGGGSAGYNTILNVGSALTQRSVFNVQNAGGGTGLTAADNAGQARTDITLGLVQTIAGVITEAQHGAKSTSTDHAAMIASGASHAPGFVPDPGAVAGVVKFLREDATWQVPSSLSQSWDYLVLWDGSRASAYNADTGLVQYGGAGNAGGIDGTKFNLVWNAAHDNIGARTPSAGTMVYRATSGNAQIPLPGFLKMYAPGLRVIAPGLGSESVGGEPDAGTVLVCQTPFTEDSTLPVSSQSCAINAMGTTGAAGGVVNVQLLGVSVDCNGHVDVGITMLGTAVGLNSFGYWMNMQGWRVNGVRFGDPVDGPAGNGGFEIAFCQASHPDGRLADLACTLTYAGSTITVQTSTNHGFVAKDCVTITGSTHYEYSGYWVVAAVTDNTHFTITAVTGLGLPADSGVLNTDQASVGVFCGDVTLGAQCNWDTAAPGSPSAGAVINVNGTPVFITTPNHFVAQSAQALADIVVYGVQGLKAWGHYVDNISTCGVLLMSGAPGHAGGANVLRKVKFEGHFRYNVAALPLYIVDSVMAAAGNLYDVDVAGDSNSSSGASNPGAVLIRNWAPSGLLIHNMQLARFNDVYTLGTGGSAPDMPIKGCKLHTLTGNGVDGQSDSGGGATCLNGATTATVTHGIYKAPGKVLITPTWDSGGWWVTAVGATTFVANFHTAPTGDHTFYWEANAT